MMLIEVLLVVFIVVVGGLCLLGLMLNRYERLRLMLVIVSRGTSPQEVAALMRAMAGDLESKDSMVGQIRKGQGSIHLIETSGPTVISRLREAADRWDASEDPFGQQAHSQSDQCSNQECPDPLPVRKVEVDQDSS